MRVLVTGGAGYIGSIAAEELLRCGHEVVVVDNLSGGYRSAVPTTAAFVEADLLQTDRLKNLLRAQGIQAVIHFAGSSIVSESVKDPGLYYRNNVVAGLSLLEAMRDAGCRRIVFSSTAAVYGDQSMQPIDEDAECDPLNPYGETKLAMEHALKWHCDAFNMQAVSLRYFNAAGASSQYGECHNPETHLIPIVLQAAAGSRPFVEVYGEDYPTRDGTCVRDYIHVTDLARAHVQALESDRIGAFNLGCGGEGYTVREVIAAAREVTGIDVPVRIAARRPGDPSVLIASSEKARRELQWTPQFQDLRTIIRSAWDWMRSHPDGY